MIAMTVKNTSPFDDVQGKSCSYDTASGVVGMMRGCRLSRCRSNAIWGVWWKNPVQKKNKAMAEAIVKVHAIPFF